MRNIIGGGIFETIIHCVTGYRSAWFRRNFLI